MVKELSLKKADLFDTKTFEPIYSYRIRKNGKWCWVFDDDKKMVLFKTKEERDQDMKEMRARIKLIENDKTSESL